MSEPSNLTAPRPSVFLSIITYDAPRPAFFDSVLRSVWGGKITDYEIRAGESLIPRARNLAAKNFLKGTCEYLLFIDTDIVFQPEDIDSLLKRAVFQKCKVVCGLYPAKNPKHLRWIINPLPGKTESDATGLLEIAYGGTGCMLIHRSVFEELKAHAEAYIADPEMGGDEQWDFFKVGVLQRENAPPRYLSEDWFFCELCRRAGIQIWADCTVKLGHIGSITYPVNTNPPQA